MDNGGMFGSIYHTEKSEVIMTQLLLKLFVKDHKNTADPKVRSAYGKLAGLVGILCNILLFAGKLLVGILTGAVSVTADAMNNLTDASSSV